MRVQEIRSREELEALRPEWGALWARCPAATPFQTPEWLLAWWDAFAPGRPAVLAFREARLVGLAPLYRAREGTLRPLGEGVSDYFDLLAEGGLEEAVAGAFLERLKSEAGCELTEVPAGSPLLAAPVPRGLAARVDVSSVCPVLALPQNRPSALRHNLRRYGSRLAAAGVAPEMARPKTLPEFVEALFRLHRRWWEARGGAGVLRGPEIRQFHERAAAALMARGLVRFHGLRGEGGLRGVLYGLAWRGRLYLYLGGFDPELARWSPGTVLLAEALTQAIGEGLREADFLRGDEPYKYRWGARDRLNYRWQVRRTGAGAEALPLAPWHS